MEKRKDGILPEKEGLDELAVRLGHLAGVMEARGVIKFEHWEDLIDAVDKVIAAYYGDNDPFFDGVGADLDSMAEKLFLNRFGLSPESK
jgi:hypothetical protein